MKFKITVIIIFLLFVFSEMHAQAWSGSRRKGSSFKDNWSLNLNFGLNSTFADLSIYDDTLIKKVTKESKFAVSMVAHKFFNKKFGISGQFMYGGMQGENNRREEYKKFFECTLIEYNFQGRVSLVDLFRPYNENKFSVELYAGIGQFLFKTSYWGLPDSTGNINMVIRDTGVPEFVYFFGGTGRYKFTDQLAITLDLALRQAQNDYIDNYNDFPEKGTYDYYTHTAIGITYYIDSKSSGGRSKMGAPRKIPIKRRRR